MDEPQLLPPEDFRRLKQLLDDANYVEEGLAGECPADSALGVLANLFLHGRVTPDETLRQVFRADEAELLRAAGLIREAAEAEPGWRAPLMLYPLEGLFIVSDFPGGGGPDYVFPAITPQSHEFYEMLPETRCDELLEIGTGSGAAALRAAAYAGRVTAGDISARCIRFAEFNRRLNGIDNVEFLGSDVYSAFAGRTFDRIVAHPPYVPAAQDRDAYRHAGPLGEDVLRRILADLALFLRHEGRFYASAMAVEPKNQPLEARLREMLGASSDQFDLLVAERDALTPTEFLLHWTEDDLLFEDALALQKEFRERDVRLLIRFALITQRRLDGRTRTQRLRMGRATRSPHLERAFVGGAAPPDDLLESRPTLEPLVRLETQAQATPEGWRPYLRVLDAAAPFAFRTDLPEWAVEALPRLDGRRTLRQALEGLEVDEQEAEDLFFCLFAGGVLRVT